LNAFVAHTTHQVKATIAHIINVNGHHKNATAVASAVTAIVVIHNTEANFGFWSMKVFIHSITGLITHNIFCKTGISAFQSVSFNSAIDNFRAFIAQP
jgi:hypothetical protein